MRSQTFGVDLSAHWFDVAPGGQVRRFATTSTGLTAGLAWRSTFGRPVRAGREATGS